MPGVLLRDDEVEPAGRELEQALFGRELGDLDAEGRLARGQSFECGGKDRMHRRLHRGDPHGRDPRLQRLELAADGLLELERPGRVRGERCAVLGQTQTPAVRHEEGDTRVLLELCELLRDRRRTVRERFGDRRERAAQRELVQEPQAAQFEHVDPSTFVMGNHRR